MSTETSERNENFNIKGVLEKRDARIKKYSIDYGIELDMKEFNQVRNIRFLKEQQKYKEMRQLKEMKSAHIRKVESPVSYKLKSTKFLKNNTDTSPSEQVKNLISKDKKKKKKKRTPSADM